MSTSRAIALLVNHQTQCRIAACHAQAVSQETEVRSPNITHSIPSDNERDIAAHYAKAIHIQKTNVQPLHITHMHFVETE